MSELRPCPFCTSSDVRVIDSSRGWRTVRCYKCLARGPADQSDASPMEDADLIAAWNTRHSPSSGVDVDVASRAIDNAILLASVYDGVAIDKDKVIADLAALRRALSRTTNTDARDAGKGEM